MSIVQPFTEHFCDAPALDTERGLLVFFWAHHSQPPSLP